MSGENMDPIAVIGIGNSLLRDDGVGIHVLEQFTKNNKFEDVDCIDAGTVGLALMDRLTSLDGLIAIDAMRLGKSPGDITVLEDEAMDAHLRKHHGSVHELGLSDLIDGLRLSGELPRRRALVGIEPSDIDWGTEPTEDVARSIPAAVECVNELLTRWQSSRETRQ